ncbi:acyltransferase family protein [Kineococcus sp. SYSU DK001]|uniref:acyltransferase family protein n=1 Tax=Kineococcus sp. SYSU DK001 TaxID=3383122 RepID=UPI003D7E9A8B
MSSPLNPPTSLVQDETAPAVSGSRPRRVSTHSVHAVRALAAVLVVVAHLTGPVGFEGKVFGGGPGAFGWLREATVGVGVDVFLVLSGFFLVLTTAGLRRGERGVGRSLGRRLVRILPLYWLATLGVLAITVVLPGEVNGSQEHAPDVLASFLLLPQPGLPLLLVGWTLTHIVAFALVFHLGLLTRSTRGLWTVLTVWAVVVAAVDVVLRVSPEGTGGPALGTLGSLFNLAPLLGAVLAQLLLSGARAGGAAALVVGSLALVVLTGLRLVPGLRGADWVTGQDYRFFGTTLAACVFLYGLVVLEQRRGWRSPRFLTSVATSSYSLYLVHVPLLGAAAVVVARFGLPDAVPARVLFVLLTLAACLGFAHLVNRWVEVPVTRWISDRTGLSRREPRPAR